MDASNMTSDSDKHAYTAFFQALAGELIGWMGYYGNDTNQTDESNAPFYASFASRIGATSLVGSNDLDFYFVVNKNLYTNSTDMPLSDQRLQDKAVARNRTLQALIEELSFNLTISLMHDPLLTANISGSLTVTAPGNHYVYNWQHLVLAYGLAIAAALTVNLFGLWAYRKNGAAFGRSFSTFTSVTRDARLRALFPQCCQGTLPLPAAALDEPIQVDILRDRAGHAFGITIHPANKDLRGEMICPACVRRRPTIVPISPLLSPNEPLLSPNHPPLLYGNT